MNPSNFDLIVVNGVSVANTGSLQIDWATTIRDIDVGGQNIPPQLYPLDIEIQDAADIVCLPNKDIDLCTFLLEQAMRESLPRPQIYIAYGLAGITLKSALLRANKLKATNEPYQRLIYSISGFIFLGTPRFRAPTKDTSKALARLVLPKGKSNLSLRRKMKQLELKDLCTLTEEFDREFERHPGLFVYEKREIKWDLLGNKHKREIVELLFAEPDKERRFEVQDLAQDLQNSARHVPPLTPQSGQEEGDATMAGAIIADGAEQEQALQEPDLNIPCIFTRVMPTYLGQFFGRDRYLENICDTFFPNELPQTLQELNNQTTMRAISLTGPGGVGKSRIAVQFVSRWQHKFDVVCWLNASSPTSLMDGYTQFAASLGLISTAQTHEDPFIIRNNVFTWFQRPVRNMSQEGGPFLRWLLVIDNVDRFEEIEDEQWPRSGHGCVLMVGRDTEARNEASGGLKGQQIGSLGEKDGEAMLLDITGGSNEEAAATSAQQIIRIWGSYPMTISLIAGIIDYEGSNLQHCANHSQEWKNKLPVLASRSGMAAISQADDVALSLALSRLSDKDTRLLEIIALMKTDSVPRQLFHQSHSSIPDQVHLPEDLWKSITALARLSLIRVERKMNSITIPSIVQETVTPLPKEATDRAKNALKAAVFLTSAYWPNVLTEEVNFSAQDDHKQRVLCERLVPQVKHMINFYELCTPAVQLELATSSLARLMVEYTWYSLDRFRFAEAEKTLSLMSRFVDSSSEHYLREFHVPYLTCSLRLSNLLYDYPRALQSATSKLEILESIKEETGRVSLKLCAAYTEKATAMMGEKHPDETAKIKILAMLETSTNLRQSLPGFKKSQLYNALRCRGVLYKKLGDLDEAQKWFKEALKNLQDEFGEEIPMNNRTAVILKEIGAVYYERKEWDIAQEYYNRSLDTMKQVYPDEPHLDNFGLLYFKIGLCETEQGRYESARNNLKAALEIFNDISLCQKEKARVLYALHEVEKRLTNGNDTHKYGVSAAVLRAQLLPGSTQSIEQLSRDDFDQLARPLES
ncbi:hypothetical protein PG985_011842 [Apiospora marii]|uniref:NB-ARC domain-containing protein n=1 Tax=Apiospora marii TaxID=335849 RepID=A0ABR1R008_9PEZI